MPLVSGTGATVQLLGHGYSYRRTIRAAYSVGLAWRGTYDSLGGSHSIHFYCLSRLVHVLSIGSNTCDFYHDGQLRISHKRSKSGSIKTSSPPFETGIGSTRPR